MGNKRYIQIDPEGYLMSDGARLDDSAFGRAIFENLKMEDRVFKTDYEGAEAIVEAFDAPLVAHGVEVVGTKINMSLPYNYKIEVDSKTLSLDEWDRFHARREDGVPIVFSRKAQAEFFDQLESFTDDSVTLGGKEIHLPSYLDSRPDVEKEAFWSERFQTWKDTGERPPWDLKGHLPPLEDIIPQLKIMKQRVAVVGCGAGHDASYLSQLGHLVTAFDISTEAIDKAKELYPETDNLKYVQMNVLEPEERFLGQFDMVFEHTFFCAIDPARRAEAIRTYRRLLTEDGHLLANFFMITPEGGPPFGATEWEIKKRLDGKFRSLYWTRWRKSVERRTGWELIYYGQKI